ncbi:putative oxidoreductase YjmC [Castellaniella defragrans]
MKSFERGERRVADFAFHRRSLWSSCIRHSPLIMTARIDVSRVRFDDLKAFIARTLVKVGLPKKDASTVGRLMAEADLQGSDGHGVIRLPQYVRRILAGGINLHPDIRVIHEAPGTAVVDGDNGMGHLVVTRAVDIALEKARTQGVAWVGTRASNHAGPASLYARRALAHDMIAVYFAVGNANHLPPWGGMDMLLSTNPISAAIPAGDKPPIVLDMATTVTSYGKVKAKAKKGEQMPVGWMIDRQGNPLLDPAHAKEGFLLPIGDYKGYGLALVFGVLAGTLQGAAMGKEVIDFNADDASMTNTGQAILVINLKAFGNPESFKTSIDTLVRDIHASRRLPGVEHIFVPGEQSHRRQRTYAESGIPIAPLLMPELNALAENMGVEPLVVLPPR